MKFLPLTVWLLGFCAPVLFAAQETLQLGKAVTVPELGIKLKVYRDADPCPLPTLNRLSIDGKQVVHPHEWWMHEQHAGTWRSPAAEISAAKITRRFPAGGLGLSTAEDCEKAAPETEEWSDADLTAWIEKFTMSKVTGVTPEKTTRIDRKVVRFDFAPKDGTQMVGFVVTPVHPPVRRIFLLNFISAAVNQSRSLRTAAAAADSIEFLPPAQLPGMQNSKGNQYQGSATRPVQTKKDYTPEYLASRDRVIDNIRNYPDWWYLETENFIIISNMRDKRAARQYAQMIEQSRSVYSKYFPLKLPLKAVSTVRLFSTRPEYVTYVGGTMGTFSVGIWMPLKRELAVSPIDFMNRKQKREMTASVLMHEGFHQYIHFAIGEIDNAVWFNEGMAEYFSGLDDRGEVRQVSDRPERMKQFLARKKPDFAALFQKTLEEFYEPASAEENYLLAGALMYYLLKGAPVSGHPEYAAIPGKFYDELLKTGDWRKATRETWKDIDMTEFTRHFCEFWNSDRYHAKAELFEPTKIKKEQSAQ